MTYHCVELTRGIEMRFICFLAIASICMSAAIGCSDNNSGITGAPGPSPNPDKGVVILFASSHGDQNDPASQVRVTRSGPECGATAIDCDTCDFDNQQSIFNAVFCVDDSLTENGDTLWVELQALHSYGTFIVQWKRSDSYWLPDMTQALTYSDGKYSAMIDHNFTIQEGDTMLWRIYQWQVTLPGYRCGVVAWVGGQSGGILYPRVNPPFDAEYSEEGGGGSGGGHKINPGEE